MRATLTDEQRRVGYAVYFLDVLEAPERSEWGGIDGAISTIVREFSLPSGSRAMVERVLIDLAGGILRRAKGWLGGQEQANLARLDGDADRG